MLDIVKAVGIQNAPLPDFVISTLTQGSHMLLGHAIHGRLRLPIVAIGDEFPPGYGADLATPRASAQFNAAT